MIKSICSLASICLLVFVKTNFLLGLSPKIVAFLQVRNEEVIIEQCLRAIAVYADAIVVLDDASQDFTLTIVKNLASELPIKKIISHQISAWQAHSEKMNRQQLLTAGRALGGTHFIIMDADEMFTANCAQDNCLRTKILTMQPGQIMKFPMINVWNGVDFYRDDALCSPHHGKWHAISCVFCDDGKCSYSMNIPSSHSGAVHIARVPVQRYCDYPVKEIYIEDINYGVIHFKCANLHNLAVKRVWYMCLEYIRANQNNILSRQQNAAIINNFYNTRIFKGLERDNKNIMLKPLSPEWTAYSFFDKYAFIKPHILREREIMEWIKGYGTDYFAPLDIWNISLTRQLRMLYKLKQ